MSTLTLVCWLLLLFLQGTRDVWASPWKPCTDLLPLDFLSQVFLLGGGDVQPWLRVVQEEGARGLQLTGPHRALGFPASQLFVNCHLFPAEFSIVMTLKACCTVTQKNQYIFSLVDEDKGRLRLGLRFSRGQLQLLSSGPVGCERRTFQAVWPGDGRWHTLTLAVTGHHATVSVDCGTPLELVHKNPFPAALSTEGSRFYVGHRGRQRNGLFLGLIRQLVLLPGSDATSRVCPSPDPKLAILSVPQTLLDLPDGPSKNKIMMYPYATAWMTLGTRSRCTKAEEGQLGFDPHEKGLFLCDGLAWVPMLQKKERLDYIEDYQDVYTSSETFDTEVFHIPSMGLFAAMANRVSRPGSGIYKWTNGKFELYQNINTFEALAWKHFTVDNKVFLAVANARGEIPGDRELSVIYKWSQTKLKFLPYQVLETHGARDWEAFHIKGDAFLAVANHRRGDNNHKIDSVIYKWNPRARIFEVSQTILTSGAYDWEFFTVGPYHFLAVANTFDGVSTHVDSSIYVWQGGTFRPFQAIPTIGATDWEAFQIGNRTFLAVANGQKLYEKGPSTYALNSTIYELNPTTQTFLKFQEISTYSAVDWEFFTLGDEKFLVVANSYDGRSYSLNSVIYRWQGYEGFVPVHWLPTVGCRDWEFFASSESSYLIYSSATERLSKVFRIKTY